MISCSKFKCLFLYRYTCTDIIALVKDAMEEPLKEMQHAEYFRPVGKNADEEILYEPCDKNAPNAEEKALYDMQPTQLRPT